MPKKATATPRMRKGLIPKGAPLPGRKGYGFVDATKSLSESEKMMDRELDHRGAEVVQRVRVPKQYLIYRKPVRITPRRGRLPK